MVSVLSLIGTGTKTPLGGSAVDRARRALDAADANAGAPEWLAADEACDIRFEGDAAKALREARRALAADALDVNVVPSELRRKKLLVADMDSTLIEQECLDELAAAIGLGERVAAITERAMRGELPFESALRERVALLAGQPAAIVEKVLAERISIMPGARVLVATMRSAGAHTVLVSGGFTGFTEPIARRLGFYEQRANILACEDGTLTGRVVEPILGHAAKEGALLELAALRGLTLGETLAIGDGANDLGMIRRAGLGVAYRGKPVLQEAAAAILDHADLTGVLFLQGYRRDEFVLSPERA